MHAIASFRAKTTALLAVLSLTLAGCFLSPGKFTSELALTGEDRFTFSYEGEIFFLALSKLAQMGSAQGDAFVAECRNDDTYETRQCTADEIAAQRRSWDEGAAERAKEAKQKAEQMAAMMGGINPSDPKAAEELAKLLMRHKGWEQVEHIGDGLFRVRYRISGTLGHDFMFPVIEGFPATNPFVQAIARKNGQWRINAPGFAAQGSDNIMSSVMGGMGALAGMAGASAGSTVAGETMPGVPPLDGTFTIRTIGTMAIRANNTDEGPETTATGQLLTWRVSSGTTQVPTALIELGG